MDIPVRREERRHHRIIHPAVHVDEAERRQVLVTGEAAVEHRRANEAAAPRLGVAQVAPGVVAQALLHGALAVGEGRPRAQVVLQVVMELVRSILRLHNGIDACWAGEIGEPFLGGDVARGFGYELAVSQVSFGAHGVAYMLLHGMRFSGHAQPDLRKAVHAVVCERLLHND